MKRYLSIALSLLLGALGVKAGVENAVTLCVENHNGEVVQFALLERPIITFKSTFVLIKTVNGAKVLKFKDIRQAYFSDEETAVSELPANPEQIETLLNTLTLRNFAPNQTVRIYTTGGAIVRRSQTDANGTLQLSTDGLRRGTYIIKSGKTAFKFIRP